MYICLVTGELRGRGVGAHKEERAVFSGIYFHYFFSVYRSELIHLLNLGLLDFERLDGKYNNLKCCSVPLH